MKTSLLAALALALLPFPGRSDDIDSVKDKPDDNSGNTFDRAIRRNHTSLFKEGRHIFRFATLADVVNHYDGHFHIGLTDAEKVDLVEYLKSL